MKKAYTEVTSITRERWDISTHIIGGPGKVPTNAPRETVLITMRIRKNIHIQLFTTYVYVTEREISIVKKNQRIFNRKPAPWTSDLNKIPRVLCLFPAFAERHKHFIPPSTSYLYY